MLKILQFADLHSRERDLPEIEKCLHAIIEIAHTEQPDLIVMAGDTFDSRMVRLDSQSAKMIFRVYQALADIAPMVVVVGTPSHDGMAPEVLAQIRAVHEIYVAERPEQIMLFDSRFMRPSPTMIPEAIISLVPAPTKQYTDINESNQDIANALGTMMAGFGAQAGAFPDVPHILCGHFSVSGAMLSDTQTMIGRDIEISQEQIGFANADLTLLGHIHLPQKIGENIFYSGSISSLNFGELHDHGCFLHTIGGDHNLISHFLKTPATKLIKLRADLTIQAWNLSLDGLIKPFAAAEKAMLAFGIEMGKINGKEEMRCTRKKKL